MSTRLYTFLKIVAIVRSHLRKKLISGNETMIIADLKEDLHEALHLSQNRVGIPVFKLEMFEKCLHFGVEEAAENGGAKRYGYRSWG